MGNNMHRQRTKRTKHQLKARIDERTAERTNIQTKTYGYTSRQTGQPAELTKLNRACKFRSIPFLCQVAGVPADDGDAAGGSTIAVSAVASLFPDLPEPVGEDRPEDTDDDEIELVSDAEPGAAEHRESEECDVEVKECDVSIVGEVCRCPDCRKKIEKIAPAGGYASAAAGFRH